MVDEKPVWIILERGPSGQWITSGPFSDREVRVKLTKGELTLQSWVWRKGLAAWTRISNLEVEADGHQSLRYQPKTRTQSPEFIELQWADRLNPIDPDLPPDADEGVI